MKPKLSINFDPDNRAINSLSFVIVWQRLKSKGTLLLVIFELIMIGAISWSDWTFYGDLEILFQDILPILIVLILFPVFLWIFTRWSVRKGLKKFGPVAYTFFDDHIESEQKGMESKISYENFDKVIQSRKYLLLKLNLAYIPIPYEKEVGEFLLSKVKPSKTLNKV
jgi:hypothetical protein